MKSVKCWRQYMPICGMPPPIPPPIPGPPMPPCACWAFAITFCIFSCTICMNSGSCYRLSFCMEEFNCSSSTPVFSKSLSCAFDCWTIIFIIIIIWPSWDCGFYMPSFIMASMDSIWISYWTLKVAITCSLVRTGRSSPPVLAVCYCICMICIPFAWSWPWYMVFLWNSYSDNPIFSMISISFVWISISSCWVISMTICSYFLSSPSAMASLLVLMYSFFLMLNWFLP